MKREKPTKLDARVYKRHRAIIKRKARELKVSQAEVVRRAIEKFAG